MKIIRKLIDNCFFPLVKSIYFVKDTNGEGLHQFMIFCAQKIHQLGLTKFLLKDKSILQNFFLSNAAGWDKDAKIGNDFFQYLGFQRIVLGSVTSQSCIGNRASFRTKRLQSKKSMLNWLGLPNDGAQVLSQTIAKQKYYLPITINVAASPHSANPCNSILETMQILKNYGDRWEINLSCPNTKEKESWQELKKMVQKISQNKYNKELYWKISPQWQKKELEQFLKICNQYIFTGFVAGNSSLVHPYQPHPNWKGGLSGELLFSQSYQLVQNLWQLIQKQYSQKNWKIIACGGISSQKQLFYYKKHFSITEFQIYTSFIFQGTKIIRKLQNGN